jgi:hypothetical protein
MISEYSGHTITEEQLTLDGKEKELRAPLVTTTHGISPPISNADTD